MNHPPVADPQSVSTPKNTAAPITLTASDGDADQLTYRIVSGPSHGTLTGTAPDTPTQCHFHGHRSSGEVSHVSRDHHWIKVTNGRQPMSVIHIWVNGTDYAVSNLTGGATRFIDIQSALRKTGNNRTFMFALGARDNASADVTFATNNT